MKTKLLIAVIIGFLIGVIVLVGLVLLVGGKKADEAQKEADDARKIANLQVIRSSIAIDGAATGKYPTTSTPGMCERISVLPNVVKNLSDIDFDHPDYFYCAGDQTDRVSQWFILGVRGITEGSIVLNHDNNVGSACEPEPDTVYCIAGGNGLPYPLDITIPPQ